jgi:hypothetical protein
MKIDAEVSEHKTAIQSKADALALIDLNLRMDEMPSRKDVKKVKSDINDTVETFKKQNKIMVK